MGLFGARFSCSWWIRVVLEKERYNSPGSMSTIFHNFSYLYLFLFS